MTLDSRPSNIIAKSDQKKVKDRLSGKKKEITVVGWKCLCSVHPCHAYFEGKYLNQEWTVDEIPGTLYGMSNR